MTVTLSNTGKTAVYYRVPRNWITGGGDWAAPRGGTAPFFSLPRLFHTYSHPPLVQPLAAGQRLTETPLVPLLASGAVTLTAQVGLLRTRDPNGVPLLAPGAPALPIGIAPAPLMGRVLRLRRSGQAALVGVDRGPVPPLVMFDQIVYTRSTGVSLRAWGWRSLVGSVLMDPVLPRGERTATWTVLVGAPGHRIASAVYVLTGP